MSRATELISDSGDRMLAALGGDTPERRRYHRRLLAVSAAYVCKWLDGSDAPREVLEEACIRMAGHLRGTQSLLGVRRMDMGPVQLEGGNPAASFRHSGAMSLLSPWKSRGVGLVGGTTPTPKTPTPTPATPEETNMPTVIFYLLDLEAGISGFQELPAFDASRWVTAGEEVSAPPTRRAVSVIAPVQCFQRRFTALEKLGIDFRWAAVAVPAGQATPSHFRRSDAVPADDWGERWRAAPGHADIGGTSHTVFWFPQVIGGGGVDFPAVHTFEWPVV